jgi:hypothetical protein
MQRKIKKRKQPKGLSKSNIVGYAGVPVHGTGVYDALKYTTLTCTSMSETVKTYVESVLKTITTGAEVKTLPNRQIDGVTNGWRVTVLDMMGRVILVTYLGIECALYYKRQLTEIKLLPGDKHPEGVLKDPNDAWQRLDLLGRSAKQQNIVLTNLHNRLKEENSVLKNRISTLEALNAELESLVRQKDELHAYLTEHEKSSIRKRKKVDDKKLEFAHKREIIKKHIKVENEAYDKKMKRKRKRKKK